MQTSSLANLKLILAGGGDAEDSRPLDERFAHWVGERGRVLYLPVAARKSSYEGYFGWFSSVFEPLGLTRLVCWDTLEGRHPAELLDFQGIYIGGGNTFWLLHLLRQTGFDQGLLQALQQGIPIYGGSAGAIIFGHSIATALHADPNDVQLQDLSGLNLLGGLDVWCHYTAQDHPLIAQHLQTHTGVLALPEQAGLVLAGNTVTPLGSQPVQRFDLQGVQDLKTPFSLC